MQSTQELQTDHVLLRSTLALVEGLLPLAPIAQFSIRDLMYSLTRRLRCHMEKEELLLFVLQEERPRPPFTSLAPFLRETHQDQRQTFTHLLGRLAEDPDWPNSSVVINFPVLIDGLRRHMTSEEAEVFPLLDRALSEDIDATVIRGMREIARRHYPEGESPWRAPSAMSDEEIVLTAGHRWKETGMATGWRSLGLA